MIQNKKPFLYVQQTFQVTWKYNCGNFTLRNPLNSSLKKTVIENKALEDLTLILSYSPFRIQLAWG